MFKYLVTKLIYTLFFDVADFVRYFRSYRVLCCSIDVICRSQFVDEHGLPCLIEVPTKHDECAGELWWTGLYVQLGALGSSPSLQLSSSCWCCVGHVSLANIKSCVNVEVLLKSGDQIIRRSHWFDWTSWIIIYDYWLILRYLFIYLRYLIYYYEFVLFVLRVTT